MLNNDPDPLPKQSIKVAVVYNLKHKVDSDLPDAEAEFDSMDTVDAIKEALEKNNIQVFRMEADETIFDRLMSVRPDIVFNIAEGRMGKAREAQIPAALELMGIPYTGSDPVTLSICLDKALTKRILSTYHIRSPKSIVIKASDAKLSLSGLHYPVIVKPNSEGSSKGINDVSIVDSPKELRALIKKNISLYNCDMLAEEYISGREFTVGVIGNDENIHVFHPMEIMFKTCTQGSYSVYSFNVKQNYKKYIEYQCPSSIDSSIEEKMMDISRTVYKTLGCRDFARMDFRVDDKGEIFFIEINPLPGLAPGYSDYPMLADFCGVGYDELVFTVLYEAAKRCGIALDKG